MTQPDGSTPSAFTISPPPHNGGRSLIIVGTSLRLLVKWSGGQDSNLHRLDCELPLESQLAELEESLSRKEVRRAREVFSNPTTFRSPHGFKLQTLITWWEEETRPLYHGGRDPLRGGRTLPSHKLVRTRPGLAPAPARRDSASTTVPKILCHDVVEKSLANVLQLHSHLIGLSSCYFERIC